MGLQLQLCSAEHIYCCENILKSQHKMSDAEVKNDVAAEAPSAEELKAKKRSAEDDDLGEEEEDLDGEGEDELDEEDGGEGLFWMPGQGHFYSEENDEEGEEEEGEEEGEEGE